MTEVSLVARQRRMRLLGRFAMSIARASALVLLSVSPAFASLTCSAANVTLNYGSYDILAGTALNAAGTVTVTCTKTGGTAAGNVSYNVALTPLTPRQLLPPSGTDVLSHQFYVDSARTRPWGDGTGGTFLISGTFSVARRATASDVPKNFYAAVTPGGQDVSAASPGPAPTTYTQTFTVTVTCTSPAGPC
jgi:spore coat protein U domain-containing protein, fimbrial subunit CupE1/2/3/6